jgi:hypothetical protein
VLIEGIITYLQAITNVRILWFILWQLWRMPLSRMCRRVGLERNDVSEEVIGYIIRVKESANYQYC